MSPSGYYLRCSIVCSINVNQRSLLTPDKGFFYDDRDWSQTGGKLRATLDQVVDFLNKQDLVSELTSRQATPRHELLQSLLVKQQLAEVQRRIAQLHPADLAFVLEGLPLNRRHVVWDRPSRGAGRRAPGTFRCGADEAHRRHAGE